MPSLLVIDISWFISVLNGGEGRSLGGEADVNIQYTSFSDMYQHL